MLKLAENLLLPIAEAATQKFAFLGSNGSGKSYAAMKLGEEMLRAGSQIIVIDPVGIWHGLRRKADGSPSDFNVLVFGGLHGDLPLTLSMAKAIAQLVVTERLSVILDLKLLRRGERKQFAAAFAEEFHHSKAQHRSRSPVHLFLEEAQNFVPQRLRSGDRDDALAAFYAIATEGRNDGIGITVISPSPQDVDKRVLNLSQCLLAFRLTGPQECEAIQKWIQRHRLPNEANIASLLPTLEIGQPYVWSPGWLKQSGIVQIDSKQSYDSSNSPSFHAAIELPKLPNLDLDAVRVFLEKFVENPDLGSSAALQPQIAALKRENVKSQLHAQTKPVERIEVPVFREGEIEQLRSFVEHLTQISEQTGAIAQMISDRLSSQLPNVNAHPSDHSSKSTESEVSSPIPTNRSNTVQLLLKDDLNGRGATHTQIAQSNRLDAAVLENQTDAEAQTEPALPTIQQRILDAIAFFQHVGIPQPKRSNVAIFCGLSATAGYFKNNVSNLRQKGLLDYPDAQSVQLTAAGTAITQVNVDFHFNHQLHQIWLTKRLCRKYFLVTNEVCRSHSVKH